MKKNIIILGSTGSIGRQTLEVVRQHPDRLKVVGLVCNSKVEEINKQAQEFKPEMIAVANKDGEDKVIRVATLPNVDIVVMAMVGIAGLKPTLAAIKKGRRIALATKEVMVVAGGLVKEEARKNQSELLPVDSEHSAIFQCLTGGKKSEVKKIYLTCSGGPFFGKTKKELETVTLEQTLKHPTWKMGQKITVDSATLMNKGLEVVEAAKLFDLRASEIEVVIHPQSLIHSMVEFKDGSILAQVGPHDMRLPIQYALSYPERWVNYFDRLDFFKSPQFTFSKPDYLTFPCLKLAYQALKIGETMLPVLNAANEIAVSLFLAKKLPFIKIPMIIERVMQNHKIKPIASLADILQADQWARKEARKMLKEVNG